MKTQIAKPLSNKSQSHLTKSVIESPYQLKDSDLEEIVNAWDKKCLFSFLVYISDSSLI